MHKTNHTNSAVILTLFSVLVFSACTREAMQKAEPVRFTATLEQGVGSTKTMLLGWAPNGFQNAVSWTSDTLIIGGEKYVQVDESNTFEPMEADKIATITPAGAYLAYYPQSIYDNGTLSLPGTQVIPLKFFVNEYYDEYLGTDEYEYIQDSVIVSHLPMYAESSTTELHFRNLCSALELPFKQTMGAHERWIKIESSQLPLWGPFQILDNCAVIDESASTADEKAAHRTLWVKVTGSVGEEHRIQVALPEGDYPQGSLTVTLMDENKNVLMPTLSNASESTRLLRNHIHNMGAIDIPYLDFAGVNVVGMNAGSKTVNFSSYNPRTQYVDVSSNRTALKAEVLSGSEYLQNGVAYKNYYYVDYDSGAEYGEWISRYEFYVLTNNTASERTIVIRFFPENEPYCSVTYTFIQPANPNA